MRRSQRQLKEGLNRPLNCLKALFGPLVDRVGWLWYVRFLTAALRRGTLPGFGLEMSQCYVNSF
jgi:hypothetical protein